MNTLVAVAIAPFGVGDELSKEVAEVVNVIRDSGLPIRTEVIMKMDIRPGYNNMMTEKIDRMENQMQK